MSADASGNDLKRVNSYQWPAAHVGHLTEGQQGALEKFKALCKEKGYYDPGDGKSAPSHDDETLLRYLRARKFIPQDAFKQFKDTEDWRAENKIDELYETIDINEYEQTRVLYPQWTGRRDKRGIPYYIFEVGNLNSKDISANQNDRDRKASKEKVPGRAKVPRRMLRLFALYENLCRFVLPLCSALPDRPNPETPVSQSNNIVDISKVSLRQFWSLRSHMQDASNLATAHYPETLDRIFIVGAPSFFPTVWEWCKAWFDPITVSKIFILKNAQVKPTLEKYIDIEDLPKKYGGNLDWEFGDMPALEPSIANSLRWKEDIRQKGHRTFPIGPIKWQYDEDGDLVAVAMGTENGRQRHRVLAGLHPEAGVTRLALSPGRAPANSQQMASIASVTSRPSGAATATATAATSTPEKPPNDTAAAAANPDSHTNGTTAEKMSGSPSQTEAYSVPYRDDANAVHHPPPDGRQGTSASRYEQQSATHAHGILSHGTPSVQTDGQGVQHTVVEPRTVGQAPKETALYREGEAERDGAGEGQGAGVLGKVQETAGAVAGQVVGTVSGVAGQVAGAVGLGGKSEGGDGEKEGTEGKGDERVGEIEPKVVEEFLREKNMSRVEDQKTE